MPRERGTDTVVIMPDTTDDTPEGYIWLGLDREHAAVLLKMMARVGGDPQKSRRYYAEHILDAMQDHGVHQTPEYRAASGCLSRGRFNFVTEGADEIKRNSFHLSKAEIAAIRERSAEVTARHPWPQTED